MSSSGGGAGGQVCCAAPPPIGSTTKGAFVLRKMLLQPSKQDGLARPRTPLANTRKHRSSSQHFIHTAFVTAVGFGGGTQMQSQYLCTLKSPAPLLHRQNVALLRSIVCASLPRNISRTASSAESTKKAASQPSNPQISPFGLPIRDAKLNPTSLRKTLDAHRDANRASFLRKTFQDDVYRDSASFRPKISYADRANQNPLVIPKPMNLNIRTKKTQDRGNRKKDWMRKPQGCDLREDHVGTAVPLTSVWDNSAKTASSPLPWMDHYDMIDGRIPSSAREALSWEIRAFEAYITPSKEEVTAAEVALDDMKKAIRSIDQDIEVTIIGSRGNGLASPLSDVDVNLSHPSLTLLQDERPGGEYSERQRKRIIDMIWRVNRALSPEHTGTRLFDRQWVVMSAKVPICAGFHVSTGLKYQVQSSSSCHASLAYARSYQDEFPTLRPLFWLLKHILHIRGLGEGRAHGLGGYPTLVMLVAALKMGAGSYRPDDVGAQFLHVLDFYSKHDFSKYGISIQPLQLFRKRPATDAPSQSEKALMQSEDDEVAREAVWRNSFINKSSHMQGRKGRGYLMSLQDPADPLNDLGANAWKIKYIQATLIELKERLDSDFKSFTNLIKAKDRNMRAIRNFSLLKSLVGANYTDFNNARTKLRIAADRVRDPRAAWDKAYAASAPRLGEYINKPLKYGSGQAMK